MLRMSIYSHRDLRYYGENSGYPYSSAQILKHLRQFKHNDEFMQVDLNSPKSKVQMYYGSEPGIFYSHQYKIKMAQIESTMAPDYFAKEKLNEFWTANHFSAQGLQNAGISSRKIYVYEHGVDSEIWSPKLRGENKKIRFLQIDAGQPRKRSDLSIKAFIAAFEGKDDYYLTLKYSDLRVVDLIHENLKLSSSPWAKKHISHVREQYDIKDLVKMYHDHDIMLYPSEGEGFGMIPLQALATGMPVISTSKWCSYDKYFKDNIIESKLGVSSIQENYPRRGEVVLADIDSLIYQMKKVSEDLKKQSSFFYNQVPEVTKEYNWQTKTNEAFGNLIERIGPDMFTSYRGYMS